MKIKVHDTSSLEVFSLSDHSHGRPLYEEPRTEVEVDIEAVKKAIRQGVSHGQLLAVALGQKRGTFINGQVTVIDAIFHAIQLQLGNAPATRNS